MLVRFLSAALAAGLFFSCATPAPAPAPTAPAPVPAPEPAPYGAIDKAETLATGLDSVSFAVSFTVTNPSSLPLQVERLKASVRADGFSGDDSTDREESCVIAPRTAKTFAFRFETRTDPEGDDVSGPAPRVPYVLSAVASCRDGEGRPLEVAASGDGSFPRVRKPVFEIRSIKISRAELINTRLKVALRVTNPNDFGLSFRSIAYELFGEGRFWADGVVSQPTPVPAAGSTDIDLSLVMNFINMKRELLDQVIALENVRYRFKGEATTDTTIDFLPSFSMKFDRSGLSKVVE